MDLFFSNPDKAVQDQIELFNMKYIRILTLVFGLIQLSYLTLTFTSYFDNTPELMQYRLLYSINLFVCLFFAVSSSLFYFKNNKKAKWVVHTQSISVILVIICTILISHLDFRYGGDVIFYCTVVLGITTLTLQSPLQALLFHFIAGFFYLVFWDSFIGSIEVGYTIKFISFTILCYASGVVKYKLYANMTKSQIELKNMSEEFRQSSLKDSLTGVKNRRALIEDSYLFCNEKCFFLFTDIDHFKLVNDNYGHQNGDFVINYFAQQLCKIFKKEHVYRFGGDEFMVAVPYLEKEESEKALNKLQNSLKGVIFDNQSHDFSVSGGYLFTKLGCSDLTIKIEDLLRNLDHALYKVKENGRGYFLQG